MNKDTPEPETLEERAANKRWLYRTTAKHLRKMGYPDRAVFYEEQLASLERDRGIGGGIYGRKGRL